MGLGGPHLAPEREWGRHPADVAPGHARQYADEPPEDVEDTGAAEHARERTSYASLCPAPEGQHRHLMAGVQQRLERVTLVVWNLGRGKDEAHETVASGRWLVVGS